MERDEALARQMQAQEDHIEHGEETRAAPKDGPSLADKIIETSDKFMLGAAEFSQNARKSVMTFFDKVANSVNPPEKSPTYSNLPDTQFGSLLDDEQPLQGGAPSGSNVTKKPPQ